MDNFIEQISQSREKIVALLLVNMFTLWLLTISTVHIIKFPPDPLYYTKQLPIYYWVGITLACIVLIILLYNSQLKSKKYKLVRDIGFIAILILYLSGTPSFIYTAPRYVDTYTFSYEIINPVIEAGSAHIAYRGTMYQTEFQGSTLLFATLVQVIGVSASLFSKYYMIYSMFIISIFIYIIARKISEKYCLFAPVAYLSLAWTAGYHFCPQSHTLMLSVALLYLVIISMINKDTNINITVLIIITWFAICVSHAITPILNLISFFFLLFFYIFFKYCSSFKKKYRFVDISIRMESFLTVLTLFVTVYIAYILYVSNFIFARVISTMQTTINNMIYGETFTLVDRGIMVPTQSYIFCYNIRMVIIMCTVMFGILSIFYLFLKNNDRTSSFVISSLFAGYSFLGIYFVISGYNVYGADRSFMFLLIPFSILCTMVLHTGPDIKKNNKIFRIFKISMVIFVIAAMFLFPITKYASDPYEFISESEHAGMKFTLQQPALSPYSRITTFYAPLTFTNLGYNWAVLKRRGGGEYTDSFNATTLNRIYDSGQCKMHQTV